MLAPGKGCPSTFSTTPTRCLVCGASESTAGVTLAARAGNVGTPDFWRLISFALSVRAFGSWATARDRLTASGVTGSYKVTKAKVGLLLYKEDATRAAAQKRRVRVKIIVKART